MNVDARQLLRRLEPAVRPAAVERAGTGRASFDRAGFDDLLNRSASLGIDVHRIGLTGGSAGGGEIHYLSWVYRTLDRNWERYTPVAMVYTYLL